MNENINEQSVDMIDDELDAQALYPGDLGSECFEVRQLLVYLLKGPYLFRDDKKQLWKALINHTQEVKVQLANLFLELFISEADGIAFVRPAKTGDLDAPQILPSYTYTFLDSVMLIFLRERLLHSQQRVEQALVTDDEMVNTMRMFDPSVRNDEAKLRRKLETIQKRFITRHLIMKVQGLDGFVISPILKYVFTATELSELKENYRKKTADLEKRMQFTGQTDLIDDQEENQAERKGGDE